MALAGTVVNGAIRLDGDPQLPEGVRVRVEFENVEKLDDIPPPPAESYEQHLAILRESIEEERTGQTRPAREVLRELAIKYGLTPQPGD